MPRGLANSSLRDPANYTLAEWQQAKRAGHDARAFKDAVQDAWAISDGRGAFASALKERGLWLARGDRRGHVLLDHTGEVYGLARTLGLKPRRFGAASEMRRAYRLFLIPGSALPMRCLLSCASISMMRARAGATYPRHLLSRKSLCATGSGLSANL